MMIYENKEVALKSREKFIYFKDDDSDLIFNSHYKKYEFFQNENTPKIMGQYFLYELYLSNSYGGRADKIYKSVLTYPKLGIYLNGLPCDQTIEVEWVDYRRTWEWNTEYKSFYTDGSGDSKEFNRYISELETEINRLPLWSDSMLIYDVWDSKPNWLQLRQAYERTWWFWRTEEEKRDLKLNRLLK